MRRSKAALFLGGCAFAAMPAVGEERKNPDDTVPIQIAMHAESALKGRMRGKLIHNEPAIAEFFILQLLARSDQTRADLVDQLFNSSEKRLARALFLLANFDKDSEPDSVLPNISQETLAEMIGTTRARVNFFMNKFRRLGLIDYNGQIKVHRSLLSLFLHEEPKTKS